MRTHLLSLTVAVALAAATPAVAQVERIQVIVPSELSVTSTSNKAVIEALKLAQAEAAKNAWRVIKVRPDIALKVRNFTPEQNAQIAQGLAAQCQVLFLDHTVDKKLQRLSARYRFDCNQQDLIVSLNQYQAQHAEPTAAGIAERPMVASLFLVKEVDSITSFDADIDRSASRTVQAGVATSGATTAQYQTDDRVRARTAGTSDVRGSESWSEAGGRLTEGLKTQENGALTGRVEGRGKSTASISGNVNTVVAVDVAEKQQGRTINRAAVAKYRSASSEELNSTLTDVLKNAGVRVVQYADFPANCPGPNADMIMREFGAQEGDLSSAVRTGVVNAARTCQIKYIVIGEALVDGTQADPFSGASKSSVIVRAKVWRIDSLIPEVVATIQKDAAATNSNLNVARASAVFQGAQRTGEEILARLTAEGVR